MACRFPDANSPGELWENVLAQRQSFRRIPPERLRLEDYLTSQRSIPDSTYSSEAALLEGFEFDRQRYRVAGELYRTVDPTHWLALDVATQALADAGYPDGKHLPHETTGVVVGNTLTGDFSRAAVMRLRWPFVRRVVESEMMKDDWPVERRQSFLDRLATSYKEPFPPVGEETLAGSLSNTIAGRICNYYNFRGGGYTVDGACASSLIAVSTACSLLISGDLDVALAGGVDLSLDPFELVGFAKVGALALRRCVFTMNGQEGFLPGEGCGW
jgi:enediyne polyketide synthase